MRQTFMPKFPAGPAVSVYVLIALRMSFVLSFNAAILCSHMLRFVLLQNYQKQEREAAKLVQKQSTYKLLSDEDDNDADNQTLTSKGSTIPSSKSQKHFRRKADQDGGDDDAEDV